MASKTSFLKEGQHTAVRGVSTLPSAMVYWETVPDKDEFKVSIMAGVFPTNARTSFPVLAGGLCGSEVDAFGKDRQFPAWGVQLC